MGCPGPYQGNVPCAYAAHRLATSSAPRCKKRTVLPDKVRSGLIDALHVLRDVEGIAQVRLTEKDVVRHRLVQQIVKAYEKAAEEKAPGSHNHKQTMEVD